METEKLYYADPFLTEFDARVLACEAEKGGYAHFMLKEIHEQPTAIKTTIQPRIRDGLPNLEECGITPEVLKGFRQIFVVACGTAMHAGMVGKYVIEKLAKVPVTVDIASEFRYRDPLVGEGDLVIIISQSGETADKGQLHCTGSRYADLYPCGSGNCSCFYQGIHGADCRDVLTGV